MHFVFVYKAVSLLGVAHSPLSNHSTLYCPFFVRVSSYSATMPKLSMKSKPSGKTVSAAKKAAAAKAKAAKAKAAAIKLNSKKQDEGPSSHNRLRTNEDLKCSVEN